VGNSSTQKRKLPPRAYINIVHRTLIKTGKSKRSAPKNLPHTRTHIIMSKTVHQTTTDQETLPDQACLPQVIRIPDVLARWPWPRAVNPHYEECKRESSAWIESFAKHAFGPRIQKAFKLCDTSMLLCLSLLSYDSSCYASIGLIASMGYAALNKGMSLIGVC
jgi:hypothetical protein